MIKELQSLMDQVNRKLAEKGIQIGATPIHAGTALAAQVLPVVTPVEPMLPVEVGELGSAITEPATEIVNTIDEIIIQGQTPEVIEAAVPQVELPGRVPVSSVAPVGMRTVSSVTRDAAARAAGHLASLVIHEVSDEAALNVLIGRGIVDAGSAINSGYVADIRASKDDASRLAIHLQILENDIIELFENKAIKAKSQDTFSANMKVSWFMSREEGRAVYKALRITLGAEGRWPNPALSRLAQAAEKMGEEKAARRMNPEKGVALKQVKKDVAVQNNGELLVVAQRTAVDLAVNGPITIDDVTESMGTKYQVAPSENEKAQNWKGSVFGGAEWVKVGQMPSRLPEAHGRMVSLWALKAWLEEHTMNGRSGVKSAFDLSRILSDFRRAHPGQDLKRCNFLVGDQRLSQDCRETIVAAQNKLYEIPVAFVPGAVGAMIMSPNYEAEQRPA